MADALKRASAGSIARDSAAIPAELVSRGFKPDSLRWWIDRWEDETIGSGGMPAAAARPASHARPGARQEAFRRTMLQVKRYFSGS